MCITMFTRINVPLFFMISGALLLGKEEHIGAVLKRVLRIAIVILMIDAIILTVAKLNAMKQGWDYTYTLSRYLYGIFSNEFDGSAPYWYLYAYMGFLFMLPFMQKIAKQMRKSEFILLVVLHFAFDSLIPLLNVGFSICNMKALQISSSFQVPLASIKAFFYPLIGYYLEYNIDVEKIRGKIVGLILAGCVGIMLSNLCTYYEALKTGHYSQNYVQLFDYVAAIVTFLIIKYATVTMETPKSISQAINLVGGLTFGIYLFDPILKKVLYNRYQAIVDPMFPTIIVSFGWIILSMLLGGSLTYILKKIPGVRKLL